MAWSLLRSMDGCRIRPALLVALKVRPSRGIRAFAGQSKGKKGTGAAARRAQATAQEVGGSGGGEDAEA